MFWFCEDKHGRGSYYSESLVVLMVALYNCFLLHITQHVVLLEIAIINQI
jgi:hypothetical protein